MKVYRQLLTASLVLPASLIFAACSSAELGSEEGSDFDVALPDNVAIEAGTITPNAVTEAPTGFGQNGLLGTGTAADADFDALADVFGEVDFIDDGLGPVFNAQACRECHQNPTIGGGAQFTELRAGHFNGTNFIDAPGGSLINDRAIDPAIQERVPENGFEVRTFRVALNLMGDGFVESIDSNTLAGIAAAQPAGQRGTVIQVAVLESPGNNRVGRFGIKNQNSSLLSFAGDAYTNEVGVTNRLVPAENSSMGNSVAGFDTVADFEDVANDIDEFAELMRSLKAPARGPINATVNNGQTQFGNAGCAVCHTPTIQTAPPGTVINGGAFTVPAALGDKIIHPFGDFLLHNIGTGDGIVQNGGQGTRNQVRTMPLWGIRSKSRFMHDTLSVTIDGAIQRHAGQATTARNNFNGLSAANRAAVVAFILSL